MFFVSYFMCLSDCLYVCLVLHVFVWASVYMSPPVFPFVCALVRHSQCTCSTVAAEICELTNCSHVYAIPLPTHFITKYSDHSPHFSLPQSLPFLFFLRCCWISPKWRRTWETERKLSNCSKQPWRDSPHTTGERAGEVVSELSYWKIACVFKRTWCEVSCVCMLHAMCGVIHADELMTTFMHMLSNDQNSRTPLHILHSFFMSSLSA